jgi:hypothetical protein
MLIEVHRSKDYDPEKYHDSNLLCISDCFGFVMINTIYNDGTISLDIWEEDVKR